MDSSREDVNKLVWSAAGFQSFERGLNGQANAPLHALRKRAFGQFEKVGFPSTKNEDWKYTNIAKISDHSFALPPLEYDAAQAAELLGAATLSEKPAAKLVFINGRYAAELSEASELPAGLKVKSIAQTLKDSAGDPDRTLIESSLGSVASYEHESFVALNTAFVTDGALVIVEAGAVVTAPVELIFVTTSDAQNGLSNSRVFVSMGDNSKASLLECYIGAADTEYLANSVFEAHVSESAVLEHTRLQLESKSAYHVSAVCAAQASSSKFTSNCFSVGGKIVRNNASSVLRGEEIVAAFNGLSVLGGDQHVDNNTLLDHAKPNSESHELYKGIYGDKSRGVFSGTIIVRPDAQKTNAFQSNSGLLLSDDAAFDTKPQLKIWADDVKCSHGATVGQLDDESMFYLRSRGIPEVKARRMLVRAYASDVVSKVECESARDVIWSVIEEKLARVEG
ncbi:MAG: Fe-S cluster assembly protein SufD [Bdellovibrionales bacterium]|nr:Fe-S cluster assembly protein SufD [Bdellovibrionales bacterium]